MKIIKVRGGKFISHKKTEFELNFNRPTSFITGPNGSGKTLLLELIFSMISEGKYPWDDNKIDWFEIYLDSGDIIKLSDGVVTGWKTEFFPSIIYIPEMPHKIDLEDLFPIDYEKLLTEPGLERKQLYKDEFLKHMNEDVLANTQIVKGEPTGLKLKVKKGFQIFGKPGLSLGESRVLEMLYSVSIAKDILLVDIPEVSVHLGLQNYLMEWMRECAMNPDLQIIVSTHSPSLFKDWKYVVDLWSTFKE